MPARVDAHLRRGSAGVESSSSPSRRTSCSAGRRLPRGRAALRREEVRRPAGARAADRPRQHRQRRSRARGEARRDRRLRHDQRRPTSRSPTACRSRPAFRTCCSTVRSTASPRRCELIGALAGERRARRRARALRPRHASTTSRGASRASPPDKRPRVYYGRGPQRPRHRARRLDQHRNHRARRARATSPRELGRGGLVQVSIEQVLRVESRRDRHDRPELLRIGRARSAVARPSPRSRRAASTSRPPCRSAGSTSRRRSTA